MPPSAAVQRPRRAERAVERPRGAMVAAACALFLGAGCARHVRGPCDTPPPFHVKLRASPKMNPDAAGQPLPTVVQIFQLKGVTGLEKADFEAVFRSPKEALGEELLSSEELMVDPGQTLGKWMTRLPQVTHVAGVAMVRKPSGTTWRAVVPLAAVPAEQCKPDPAERSGDPTGEDVDVQLQLDEFQISSAATARAGRGS